MVYLFISLVFIIFIIFIVYNKTIIETFGSYGDLYNARGYNSALNDTSYNYTGETGSSRNPESEYNMDFLNNKNFKYNTKYDHRQDSGFLQKPSGSGSGTSYYTYDKDGNLVQVNGDITYHEAGNYAFGQKDSSYKPVYSDSKFKNITTGETEFTSVKNTTSQLSGICTNNANSQQQLEEACNALDKNVCASTSCCVLLGGSKCVSGDKTGPKFRSNYADSFLRNKDSYYYNGMCYGNCIKDAYDTASGRDDINVNITIDPSMFTATKNFDHYNENRRFEDTIIGSGTHETSEDSYVSPTIVYAYEYNNTGNHGMGYDQTYSTDNEWSYNNWDGILSNTLGPTQGPSPKSTYNTGMGVSPSTFIPPQVTTVDENGTKVAINTYENKTFTMNYTQMNDAISQLRLSTPDIPGAKANIQTALSMHTHNVNQLKNSLFNLNYALKHLNGLSAISISSALKSLSIASSSWGGSEIDFAIASLTRPTPNIPYGISNINDAINKNNIILAVEQASVKSLKNAFNDINTTNINIPHAIDQINYTLSILHNGALSNNITPAY